MVRGLDPPGRFLQRDETDSFWIIIDEEKKVSVKTAQALREGAPQIREEVAAAAACAVAQRHLNNENQPGFSPNICSDAVNGSSAPERSRKRSYTDCRRTPPAVFSQINPVFSTRPNALVRPIAVSPSLSWQQQQQPPQQWSPPRQRQPLISVRDSLLTLHTGILANTAAIRELRDPAYVGAAMAPTPVGDLNRKVKNLWHLSRQLSEQVNRQNEFIFVLINGMLEYGDE